MQVVDPDKAWNLIRSVYVLHSDHALLNIFCKICLFYDNLFIYLLIIVNQIDRLSFVLFLYLLTKPQSAHLLLHLRRQILEIIELAFDLVLIMSMVLCLKLFQQVLTLGFENSMVLGLGRNRSKYGHHVLQAHLDGNRGVPHIVDYHVQEVFGAFVFFGQRLNVALTVDRNLLDFILIFDQLLPDLIVQNLLMAVVPLKVDSRIKDHIGLLVGQFAWVGENPSEVLVEMHYHLSRTSTLAFVKSTLKVV